MGGLGRHRKFVHSEERPFNCPECSYKAKTKSGLGSHRKFVHSEQVHLDLNKQFCCHKCSFKVHDKLTLVNHLKEIHPIENSYSPPNSTYIGGIEHLLRLQTKNVPPEQHIKKLIHEENTPLIFSRPKCTYTFKRRSDK